MVKAGLKSREYGHWEPSRWPRDTLYPQKLALTSSTSGGRSVGIVLSRTQATELVSYRWLNSYAKNRKVAGSTSNVIDFFFNSPNPSSLT
jgi:hypothetical protein